jgi:hypothetical protein
MRLYTIALGCLFALQSFTAFSAAPAKLDRENNFDLGWRFLKKAFEPEFAGKMNFYLSAVDDQLRHADDKLSIGLLLCKERDHLTVEYALRDLKKPIGVAQWQTKLVESLPKNLKGSLPTVAEIEAELDNARPK